MGYRSICWGGGLRMRKIPWSTISTLLPISKNASKSQPLRRVTTSVFVSCLPRYMGAGTGRGWRGRDAERPRPDERDCCSFGKADAGGPTSGPRPGLAGPTGPLLQPLRRVGSAGRALCSGLLGGGCKPSDPSAHPQAYLCPQTSPN